MWKRICSAFIVGGICGLIGQLVIVLISFTGLTGSPLIMVSMLGFGILTVISILCGGYFHISNFGNSGAAIPLSGLMFGAAASTASRIKKGETLPLIKGFWDVFRILLIGYILACLLGIILGAYPGTLSVKTPSLFMQFVYSMIIAALISSITQFLVEIKINFALVAILSMSLGGGVLTRFGFIDYLNTLGAGGLSVMALGSGNAGYASGVAIKNGDFSTFFIVLALLVILVGMGALCGGYILKHYPDRIQG